MPMMNAVAHHLCKSKAKNTCIGWYTHTTFQEGQTKLRTITDYEIMRSGGGDGLFPWLLMFPPRTLPITKLKC